MKKFTKKILSVALAATVSVSSLYTSSDFAKAAVSNTSKDYKAATLTVKFKPNNSDKGTPKIYAYERNPSNKENRTNLTHKDTSTSYVEMKEDENHIYSYDLKTNYGHAYFSIRTDNNRYPYKADENDVSDEARYFIQSSVMVDAADLKKFHQYQQPLVQLRVLQPQRLHLLLLLPVLRKPQQNL